MSEAICFFIKENIKKYESLLKEEEGELKLNKEELNILISLEAFRSIISLPYHRFDWEPRRRHISQMKYILNNIERILEGTKKRIPELQKKKV